MYFYIVATSKISFATKPHEDQPRGGGGHVYSLATFIAMYFYACDQDMQVHHHMAYIQPNPVITKLDDSHHGI